MAQNRSHFVNSTYHAQFKLLDKWIVQHTEELMNIFNKGNYILFGEWVYFKHSIHYTKLPDYFVAFDLYDRVNEKFMTRSTLEELLQGTSINIIRIMHSGTATIDNLKAMVNNASDYYDGPVEGVYVRAYENDAVKYRGKIVRSDFLCGDVSGNVNHWTKQQFTKNILANTYDNHNA